MNKYTYSMYVNNQWVDISNYIQTNATLSDKLDESLDASKFIIPYIKSDAIPGIDLSKAIEPYTPVKININNVETFRMYVSDSVRTIARKSNPKLYQHEVSLIEATKELFRHPIPNMTITQPKGQVFTGKYYADSKPQPSDKILIRNSLVTPTLTTINQSQDSTVLVNQTLKAGYEGEALIQLEIENYQFNHKWKNHPVLGTYTMEYHSAEVTLTLEILVNGSVVTTKNIEVGGGVGKQLDTKWWENDDWGKNTANKEYFTIVEKLPKSSNDQTVSIRMKTNGLYYRTEKSLDLVVIDSYSMQDELYVIPRLTISSGKSVGQDYTYLNEAVNKVLNLINISDKNDNNIPKYVLDSVTDSKISEILSPEFTFSGLTAWDALKNIALVVNAIPEIGTVDYRTISFRFLDDIADVVYDQSEFNDETMAYTMDDYNSYLEVNADNVIEEDILLNAKTEPYIGGYMSVRSNGDMVGQITEDNASFVTRQPIYRVLEMRIIGPKVRLVKPDKPDIILSGSNSKNHTESTYWDISDRVLEDSAWNVLESGTQNGSDSLRRAIKTKGNNIHYSQGSKYITGLGYKTDAVSDFLGTVTSPRALMESILTIAALYIGETPALEGYEVKMPRDAEGFFDKFSKDPEIAFEQKHKLFDGILAQITYIPMISSRTKIYKHNVWDLGVNIGKYANEQDRLNDTNNLGKFMSTSVNKLGNMQYTVSGQKSRYDMIPKLGYLTSNNLVVTSRDLTFNKNYVSYTLQLSKDFINQNTYLAPSSAIRQYEIPQEDVVFRQDEYVEFIALTEDKSIVKDDFSILTSYGKQKTIQNFGNLGGFNDTPLSYGKVTVTKEKDSNLLNNVVTFDMPINVYSSANTVNVQLEFESNYSAGSKKYHETLNAEGDAFKVQTYTSYTTQFGKTYSLDISVYPKGYINNSESDSNNYPIMNQETSDNSNLNLSLIIEKDARERYGVNIIFPFISAQPDTLKTFAGIAKYNGLTRSKNDLDICVALLDKGYWPSVNQTILETSKTTILEGYKATVLKDSTRDIYGMTFYNLPIPSNRTFEGYVVFERKTNEMIYAVKKPIPDGILYTTPTVWFIPKTHLKNRTIPLE